MTNLIIVESPSKCQKVAKAAGQNYICLSSKGHIYELDKGLEAINIKDNFEPKYRVMKSKVSLVSNFKKTKKKYENIFLAMDPDREGEAIALHLAMELKIIRSAKRITFNEISKSAIQNALNNPRNIDINLCDAQKARRVLDRLMGFEISPLLWSHIPDQSSLSAGRCQSPALELVAMREREIENFKTNSYLSIHGSFLYKDNKLKVIHSSKIKDLEIGKKILLDCLSSIFTVKDIESKISKSTPPAPFTTSSLQQEISQKLNLSPKVTMQKAQKLYEKGVITYMRTDSTSLSKDAMKDIKQNIIEKYGSKYYNSRQYKSKIKNAQEAHECIRPVDFNYDSNDILDDLEKKIYNIIFLRTLASQMKNQEKKINKIIILAKKDEIEHTFICEEEMTIFDGFSILYNKPDKKLTDIKIGDRLKLDQLELEPLETKPKSRYTEASLVKVLEKSGIGRPSTFSNIITTLFDRGYIEKGSKSMKKTKVTIWYVTSKNNKLEDKEITRETNSTRGKIVLTDVGKSVLSFLNDNFKNLVDSKLTSIIENDLDNVAEGKTEWYKIVGKFYESFHPQVVKLKQDINPIVKTINWVKLIGVDSQDSKYGIIKGKYGNCFAKSSDKTAYLPIVKTLYGTGSNIKIDQLIFMFTLPIQVCDKYHLNYGINGYYLTKEKDSVNLEGDYSNGFNLTIGELDNLFRDKCGLNIGIIGNYEYKIVNTKYGNTFVRKSISKKITPKYLPIVETIYGDGNDISLKEIEFLFKLPILLYDKYHLYYGRNGFYCKCDGKSANLPSKKYYDDLPDEDYLDKLLKQDQSQKSKIVKKIDKYIIMEGKYGHFILYQKKIYPIRGKRDIDSMKEKDCIEIINK